MSKRSKWLSELITREELLEHKNTLLVAPCGSGKTYFTFNELIQPGEHVLYLCDTRNLKRAMNHTWDKIVDDGDQMLRDVTIWSYHKFAKNIKNKSLELYLGQWDFIVCDEFHNLFSFANMNVDNNLELAKLVLTNKQIIPIICMTATPYEVLTEAKEFMSFFPNMHIIDFTDNLEIKRYINRRKSYISNTLQIQSQLSYYEEVFKFTDEKCLIFAEQIQTIKTIENICDNLGLSHISIWSENNDEYQLNDEQRRVRDKILNEGIMDDDYQVLIINRATETGVNIVDKRFTIFISCSSNLTHSIQARNRLRMDLDWIICKTKKKEIPNDIAIFIPEDYLNRWLTKEDVEELCSELDIVDGYNNLITGRKLRTILDKGDDYEVTAGKPKINGKQQRCIKINKKI